jgi:hypothetical protein
MQIVHLTSINILYCAIQYLKYYLKKRNKKKKEKFNDVSFSHVQASRGNFSTRE